MSPFCGAPRISRGGCGRFQILVLLNKRQRWRWKYGSVLIDNGNPIFARLIVIAGAAKSIKEAGDGDRDREAEDHGAAIAKRSGDPCAHGATTRQYHQSRKLRPVRMRATSRET
jgi:hypothetical protein